MNKVVVRRLRPFEKQKLLRMKRPHCNAVNCLHARIILLSRGGLGSRAIGERVDCSPQWVRTILHRFNDDGLDGINRHRHRACESTLVRRGIGYGSEPLALLVTASLNE